MEASVLTLTSNKVSWVLLIIVVLLLNCFSLLRSEAKTLPDEEVQALKNIAAKLKNRHWNVTSASCSGGEGLNVTIGSAELSNVTCNCSSTACHITNIEFKALNLTGVLPEEFADLPHLQEISVSTSSVDHSNHTQPSSLDFVNMQCGCGMRVAVKISKSVKNKNKLYFTCPVKRYGYFLWSYPIKESMELSELEVEPSCPRTEQAIGRANWKDEIDTLSKEVKQLEKSLATIKLMVQALVAVHVLYVVAFVAKRWRWIGKEW